MLDFKLIEQGGSYTRNRLSAINPKPKTVTMVDSFFNELMISKLLDYCETTDAWGTAQDVEGVPIPNRQKVSWEADSIVEVAHMICDTLTPTLQVCWERDLNFNGIDLWKDTEGYSIPKHTDNPMFNVSLQIYIKNLPGLSTVFEHEGTHLATNTTPGSGYIADNTVGIPHWLNGTVPSGFNRYSLHATWT